VGEQVLPDTELKLVHKVHNEHLVEIEIITEPLDERVLEHVTLDIRQRVMKFELILTKVGTEDVSLRRPFTFSDPMAKAEV
jgi:hypothetical protein